MPTGYTAEVQDGTVTEFTDFAMQCARAFGACVTMKDEKWDAEIPEAFEVSSYHSDCIEEIGEMITDIEDMTLQELEVKAEEAFVSFLNQQHDRIRELKETKTRYVSMMEKVALWEPPTSDHERMKEFMIEQLQSSIEYDCNSMLKHYSESLKEHVRKTGEEWKHDQLESLKRDLNYHIKEENEEIERVASRNKWINDLRDSLKEYEGK